MQEPLYPNMLGMPIRMWSSGSLDHKNSIYNLYQYESFYNLHQYESFARHSVF